MVKLSDNGSLATLAEANPAVIPKQSPSLTKAEIARSLKLSKLGPRHGKSFVGAGGLKPYKMPANGTKIPPLKIRTRKALRAPQQRKI